MNQNDETKESLIRNDKRLMDRDDANWALYFALKLLNDSGLSPKKINDITRKAGFEFPDDKDGKNIRNFITNRTINPNKDMTRPFIKYWIESGQAKALTAILSATAPQFVNLVSSLSSGVERVPVGMDVVGNYWLYHGSYMSPRHFVIRTLTIKIVDNQILVVEDYVLDMLRGPPYKPLFARGIMTFERNIPQILLRSDTGENKIGLSLIVARSTGSPKGKLYDFTGALLVLQENGYPASRRCIAIREEVEPLDEMREQTGIFHIDRLDEPNPTPDGKYTEQVDRKNKPILEKHKANFRRLANDRFSVDPVLWAAPWWEDKLNLGKAERDSIE